MKSIKLKFGSSKHTKVLEALNARKRYSEEKSKEHHNAWNQCDDDFQAYVKTDEADAIRKGKKAEGDPQYLTLTLPYSYAMLQSAVTYWTSVFLSRDPVLQFMGRHGQSEHNKMAVEALISYQVQVGRHMVPYHIWLQDAGRYGVGILWNYWEEEMHYVPEIFEEQETLGGIVIVGSMKKKRRVKEIKGYHGAKVFNVRCFDYLFDPRVPLTDPQAAEFVGRLVEFHQNEMQRRKLNGQYIEENVDKALEMMKSQALREREDRRNRLPEIGNPRSENTLGNLTGLQGYEMCVELVPSEWELGSSDYPEKWVFSVVDDKVILEARPLGMYHNKFPVSVIEPEIEGYSLFKRGLLEIGRPLNDTMNWLINSHYYNVRKSLQGEWVFDPTRIVQRDVLDPKPGKRIRLTPLGYGQDVRSMITSLQGDASVTQQNLEDSRWVEMMLQRVLGINDGIMGQQAQGGRKTATEVRSSTTAAINRLKTSAEYMSWGGFGANAEMILQMSQQMYDDEQKLRVAGDQAMSGVGTIDVTPESIAGMYDFSPVDGTMPIDRFAMVNMWTQLLAQLRSVPEMGASHDITKIFEWVATLGGLKNIRQFRINVMDDGALAQQVQQGNMVGERNGGAQPRGESRRPTAPGSGNSPATPLPRQIAGVGPSG